MTTTIQISTELLDHLRNRKKYAKESYEDVIWDLMEDSLELSEETKRAIAQAEADIKTGREHKWEDVKKELGLDL